MSSVKKKFSKSINPEFNEPSFNNIDIKKSRNTNIEHTSDDEQNKSGSDIEVNTITYPIKITIVGDSYVGKTSILKRYFKNIFEKDATSATVSASFNSKTIKIDPYTLADLKIWDTAGQEKYRALTKSFLNGSNGIIIVFDLSNEQSFNNLNSWIDDIKNAVDIEKVEMILVGNKSDLPNKKISYEQAKKFAEDNDMQYQTVSAKDGVNIETLFEKMGIACVKMIIKEQKKIEELKEKGYNENGERISNLSGFKNNIDNEKIIISEINDNEQNNKKAKKCC